MGDVIARDDLQEMVGREWGLSRWFAMDQARIDAFAENTEDHQFIHVDPDRATRTEFGGTVAHGMLTLSMLSAIAIDALPQVEGARLSVNYGFEKLRFIAPVPSGGRIRGRFVLQEVRPRGRGDLMLRLAATVELDGSRRPALTTEWLLLYRF